MKKWIKLIPALLFFAGFTACSTGDGNDNGSKNTDNKGAYIINYGGYDQANASITKYDTENNETTKFYYETQNGKQIGGPVQWAYHYDSKVYLTGNNPDQVLVTDESFTVIDTISENVAKPRTCIADGDNLYISCWGANPDYNAMADSYILKYNTLTKTTEKITLAGGPEGLEIANGKLYAALNYKKEIAVMNLSNQEISYIETTAASTYFTKDADNNLYVALIDSYSLPADKEGLGYINTTTDKLKIYELPGISANYVKTIDMSKDGSKVYVTAANYDEAWNLVGGVQAFDVSSETFDSEPIVSNITGINGLTVNPNNGDLYVFISNGTVDNGKMQIYTDGKLDSTQEVGTSPIMAIFID